MKTIKLITAICFLSILGTSCIGPRGYDGIDGEDGKDGIANVGVAIYDVNPSDWEGNVDGFKTILEVPEITEEVFYNGAVLVYILRNEDSDNKSFNQLPYSWLNNNNTEYMDFDTYIERIEITLRWVDDFVNTTEAPKGGYTFKVLIIEGTPLSVLQTQVDLNNSQAVINHFSNVTLF